MFEDTPNEQLRAELLAFQNAQPTELVPLPVNAERSKLSIEQQETLFENWTAHLADQPASSYSPAERAAVNFKIMRVLKGL